MKNYSPISGGKDIATKGYVDSVAGGGVTSFNSRTGVVTPQSGDYTAAMVGTIPATPVTKAEYEALIQAGTVDPNTAYLVTDDQGSQGIPYTSAQTDALLDVVRSDLAPVEPTSTASQDHVVNSFLVNNGRLYRVTASITQGDTLTVGTNITAADVGSYISRISSETAISGITTEAQLESVFDSIIATMSDNTLKFVTLAIGTNFVADIASRHLCRIFRATATYAKVEMSTYSPKGNHVKNKVNGTWEAVEYVNPPLTVDTEYRTTERFNGKPVYQKLVTIGTGMGPSATTRNIRVSHGITNLDMMIRAAGNAKSNSNTVAFPTIDTTSGGVSANVSADSNYAYFAATTTIDWSPYTIYAILKYTKTTG